MVIHWKKRGKTGHWVQMEASFAFPPHRLLEIGFLIGLNLLQLCKGLGVGLKADNLGDAILYKPVIGRCRQGVGADVTNPHGA